MVRESDRRLVEIVSAKRQMKHQQMEFYGFIHFTVNTFTDQEWGDGTESPEIFHPARLDARQWARAAQDGGMKGLILTCKHHDGFCLWPSKYTRHSVASSPYRNGGGDIVKELADACREEGLAFGVYLSPWDRNCPFYGRGREYDDFFVNQLEELLTGYGEIFTVWFDGACGEGPDGKRQVYDWRRYYETVRRLQPEACISICGPDVRWCGNEAGQTRPSEWSVVPARTADTEKIAENSQQADDEAFRQRKISAGDMDLGSREILEGEQELIWYPAEVNTSIRPGWFYHASEDNQVKSLGELISIYEHSVGGNATFLLNIPPDRNGLIHPNDRARLHELGEYIRNTYGRNLAKEARFTCGGVPTEEIGMADGVSEGAAETADGGAPAEEIGMTDGAAERATETADGGAPAEEIGMTDGVSEGATETADGGAPAEEIGMTDGVAEGAAEIADGGNPAGRDPENLKTDDYETDFRTAEGVTSCDIILEWDQAVRVRRLVLKENLRYSQRIEKFEIDAWIDGAFRSVYQGTTVGYKRIAVLEEIRTRKLRVRILDARVSVALAFLGVY